MAQRTSLTAGDILVSVSLAAILRFGLYPAYRTYFVFPWNQPVYTGFLILCLGTLLTAVPRPGAISLWTGAWALMDLAFQGGVPAYLIGYAPIPLLTELALWILGRWGDPAGVLVAAAIYGLGHSTWTWIAYNEIWLIPPYPADLFARVAAISVLGAAPAASLAGHGAVRALRAVLAHQRARMAGTGLPRIRDR
jgi:hypothetical protein